MREFRFLLLFFLSVFDIYLVANVFHLLFLLALRFFFVLLCVCVYASCSKYENLLKPDFQMFATTATAAASTVVVLCQCHFPKMLSVYLFIRPKIFACPLTADRKRWRRTTDNNPAKEQNLCLFARESKTEQI